MNKISFLAAVLAGHFGLSSPKALATPICGYEVSESDKISGKILSLPRVFPNKAWLTACNQDNRLYMIHFTNSSRYEAYYLDNPIVTVEAILKKQMTIAEKSKYVDAIARRAMSVIEGALKSQLIKDVQVLNFLSLIERTGIRNSISIKSQPGSLCSAKKMEVAFVWENGTEVFLCPNAYASEDPLYLIHEMIHVAQTKLRIVHRTRLDYECEADLVAIMATYAALKADPFLPHEWFGNAAYYEHCGPDVKGRLRSFLKYVGIDDGPYI